MTEQEKQLRIHSKMSAFTFYIDDVTKLAVMHKLKELGLDTAKGSLSATIRVLLQEFATLTPTPALAEKIKQEYLFTTRKNKRSTL
jgi:hypothetical protein